MTESTLTPARLWRRMTPEQRLRAARAFWAEEQAADDQVQAVMLIAQQKKFRPKFVLGLDQDRLWFLHNGRNEKLTDFGGAVIKDMLA